MPDLHLRDVTFPDGKVTLAGSLAIPDRRTPSRGVVMIGGSGPSNRNNDTLFPPIRRHLVEAGIEVLVLRQAMRQADGVAEQDIDSALTMYDRLIEAGWRGANFAEATRLLDTEKKPSVLADLWADMDERQWEFLKRKQDHDPIPDALRLRCPHLAIFGGADQLVPIADSIHLFSIAACHADRPGRSRLTVEVFSRCRPPDTVDRRPLRTGLPHDGGPMDTRPELAVEGDFGPLTEARANSRGSRTAGTTGHSRELPDRCAMSRSCATYSRHQDSSTSGRFGTALSSPRRPSMVSRRMSMCPA
jgi:hypothetical protein